MIDIGHLIKDARKNKGLTQLSLAQMTSRTEDHIRKIETGQRLPSPKLFLNLLNILALDIPSDLKKLIKKDSAFRSDLLQVLLNELGHLNREDADILKNLIENMSQKNKNLSSR